MRSLLITPPAKHHRQAGMVLPARRGPCGSAFRPRRSGSICRRRRDPYLRPAIWYTGFSSPERLQLTPFTLTFGVHFLSALGRLLTDIGARRERIAQLNAQAVHRLPGVEILAGTQRRDALGPLAEQKVRGAAGDVENKVFLLEQLTFPCSKQGSGDMPLLGGWCVSAGCPCPAQRPQRR